MSRTLVYCTINTFGIKIPLIRFIKQSFYSAVRRSRHNVAHEGWRAEPLCDARSLGLQRQSLFISQSRQIGWST